MTLDLPAELRLYVDIQLNRYKLLQDHMERLEGQQLTGRELKEWIRDMKFQIDFGVSQSEFYKGKIG